MILTELSGTVCDLRSKFFMKFSTSILIFQHYFLINTAIVFTNIWICATHPTQHFQNFNQKCGQQYILLYAYFVLDPLSCLLLTNFPKLSCSLGWDCFIPANPGQRLVDRLLRIIHPSIITAYKLKVEFSWDPILILGINLLSHLSLLALFSQKPS